VAITSTSQIFNLSAGGGPARLEKVPEKSEPSHP